MSKPITIFCDLDGTLIPHRGSLAKCIQSANDEHQELLPNVDNWLQLVYAGGHKLIITTGRPEMLRAITEHQCKHAGIFFDQLIMDCTPGVRMVINDMKLDCKGQTVSALNLTRNEGFSNEDLETFKV